MHSYAQTNVQLFDQLRAEGYSKQEREDVRDAYVFAMRLFTSLYLPSGKPFIDHLVGTASILASLQVPVEIVTAALLHAAYLHGDFDSVRRGISESKRRQVREAVGEKVEDYIARYDRMLMTPQDISALDRTMDQLGSVDRYVVLMRLANELEHQLDLGALYYRHREKEQRDRQRYMKSHVLKLASLAERLGFPSLAAELKKVFENVAAAEIPLEPVVRYDYTEAFLVVPPSYRRRFPVLCYRKFSEGRQTVLGLLRRPKLLSRKIFRLVQHIMRASPPARIAVALWTHIVPSYAQTNIQLFNQLRAEGYSQRDMSLVRDAYELAMSLYAASFTFSGRPHVAHGIGAASVLAALRFPAQAVAAALIHNVYSTGDFGDGHSTISPSRRRKLKRVVGAEVEEHVARFSTLYWDPRATQTARRNPNELESVDRTVFVIMFAEILERLIHGGLLYYDEHAIDFYVKHGRLGAEIAERMQLFSLAAELREAIRALDSAQPPVEPFLSNVINSQQMLVPASCRPRLSAATRQALIQARRRLRFRVRRRLNAIRSRMPQSYASAWKKWRRS